MSKDIWRRCASCKSRVAVSHTNFASHTHLTKAALKRDNFFFLLEQQHKMWGVKHRYRHTCLLVVIYALLRAREWSHQMWVEHRSSAMFGGACVYPEGDTAWVDCCFCRGHFQGSFDWGKDWHYACPHVAACITLFIGSQDDYDN